LHIVLPYWQNKVDIY